MTSYRAPSDRRQRDQEASNGFQHRSWQDQLRRHDMVKLSASSPVEHWRARVEDEPVATTSNIVDVPKSGCHNVGHEYRFDQSIDIRHNTALPRFCFLL